MSRAQGVFSPLWRWQRSDALREMCDVTRIHRTKVNHRSWKWKLRLVDFRHESHRTGSTTYIQLSKTNLHRKRSFKQHLVLVKFSGQLDHKFPPLYHDSRKARNFHILYRNKCHIIRIYHQGSNTKKGTENICIAGCEVKDFSIILPVLILGNDTVRWAPELITYN